ncbi:tyrosine-type recombinase/integrase [Acidithiobacillus sp. IBUN Pt1247-S3]|uniref:tyrosine-type recombinase/integrase n=1 Tax=Acidithiobacillus sp. IBUN Pt1247-S3 TaxID=3166642 RepID=UPI0034E5B8AD
MLTAKLIDATAKRAAKEKRAITITDATMRGIGSLRLRLSPGGTALWIYRYTTSDGKRDDLPIGGYGTKAGCLSLEQARTQAAQYASLYREGHHDLRAYLDAKVAAEAAQLRERGEESQRLAAGNLDALLDAYVGYLKDKNAPSAKDVESIFNLHVRILPGLVQKRANEITPHDLRAIFDRQQQMGLRRALGKTRAAMHSAFNLAAKSEFDSTIPLSFRSFKVLTNPVASLPTYSQLSKPGDRVLSHAELRTLLLALKADERMSVKTLLIGLYLGGQRPAQLARVTASDVDLERGIITLHDGKGRRTHPRLHVLPITDAIRPVIEQLCAINADAPSLFSSDGQSIPHTTTLSKLVLEIGKRAYQLKDVRRTAETELAAIGVSKDIRAQILSHELGGIQARHYDRHSYLPEKTDALEKWARHLDGIERGNVVTLRRGA